MLASCTGLSRHYPNLFCHNGSGSAALLGANAPAIKQRVLDARRELAAALDRGANVDKKEQQPT